MPYIQKYYRFLSNPHIVFCYLLFLISGVSKTDQHMQMATIYVNTIVSGYKCCARVFLFYLRFIERRYK
jgi:fumarate reductase subunit C